MLVPVFLRETLAAATTAPEGSLTVPNSWAVDCWAKARFAPRNVRQRTIPMAMIRPIRGKTLGFMGPSLKVGHKYCTLCSVKTSLNRNLFFGSNRSEEHTSE